MEILEIGDSYLYASGKFDSDFVVKKMWVPIRKNLSIPGAVVMEPPKYNPETDCSRFDFAVPMNVICPEKDEKHRAQKYEAHAQQLLNEGMTRFSDELVRCYDGRTPLEMAYS